MTREIEILIKDGCTKSEAERFLKNGTTVYNDFEENFYKYMEEWKSSYSGEEYDELVSGFKEMIETGIPVTDWGIVKLDGKTYYIMYVN